jgi:hypothetical protein
MKDPIEVAAWIEDEYMRQLSHKCQVWPPRSNRASEIAHPCTRYLVLDRTRGAEAKPPSPEIQAIFELGKLIERATVAELISELGIEWVWGQRGFDDTALQISGMLDGGVELAHREVLPGEIKSTQGTIFDSIRSGAAGVHDMLNNRTWMVRKWIGQMIIYLHLTGESAGLMILRDKWFWRIRVVPVVASMDIVRREMQRLIKRAEAVNKHLAEGTVPERIEYREAVCGRCKLKMVCMPGLQGEGLDIVADEKLVELMLERDELDGHFRRYKEVDEAVKAALRSLGREVIVGGLWVAKNATYTRRKMKASDETFDVTRTTITKLEKPLLPLAAVEKITEENDDE